MALPGMLTSMVGSQVTVVFPATLVALTTGCGLALSWVAGTGVKVAEPPVVASAAIRYWASAAGMVSAGVPVPVAKLLAETVAVQPAPKPRSSVTWTVPSPALRVPPGAAEPRLAVAGAVMESGPATTATVTAQPGLPDAPGQVLPVAVEVTVLAIMPVPVSGSLTVTV